jgi:crotonobetainyl-CoA:carnitine CoA-transferase CaiB-like acyl-CoA transferase
MLPLEGTKILDLSRLAPGPFCSMLLGDMGADVLLVEAPAEGKMAATAVFSRGTDAEKQAAYNLMGRNKRSIVLNLREQEAREIFYRLADEADVVLEGFRPGVVKRLGVDYDTLSQRNPRLVYCSLSGFGQTGPYSNLVGHDINYISVGGALGMIGCRVRAASSIGSPTASASITSAIGAGRSPIRDSISSTRPGATMGSPIHRQ